MSNPVIPFTVFELANRPRQKMKVCDVPLGSRFLLFIESTLLPNATNSWKDLHYYPCYKLLTKDGNSIMVNRYGEIIEEHDIQELFGSNTHEAKWNGDVLFIEESGYYAPESSLESDDISDDRREGDAYHPMRVIGKFNPTPKMVVLDDLVVGDIVKQCYYYKVIHIEGRVLTAIVYGVLDGYWGANSLYDWYRGDLIREWHFVEVTIPKGFLINLVGHCETQD